MKRQYKMYLASEIELIKGLADLFRYKHEDKPDDASTGITQYVVSVDVPIDKISSFEQSIIRGLKQA